MSFKKNLLLLALFFFQIIPLTAFAAPEISALIDTAACKKPVDQGGWGGDCYYKAATFTDGCTGNTKFVGYCGGADAAASGLFDVVDSCCVPSGSTAKGPIVGQYMESDNICTLSKQAGGQFGGTCKNACDNQTEDYIGICGDNENSCCTPKGSVPTPADTGKISGASLSGVGAVSVNTTYTPLENVPFLTGSTFQDYVLGVYKLAMVLVVIAAVFMLVIGGFQYLTSAGNTSAMSSAKHTIEGALFGLVLALVAYLILYVINPDLTNLNISTFQPLAQRGTSSGGGGTGGGGASGGTATSSLSAQNAAKKLLASRNVSLVNTNSCTGSYAAGSRSNLEQVVAGNGMTRCPCGGGGNVEASPALLNSLVDLADAGARFQINVLAGGCHTGSNSNHYKGTAADIQRTPALDSFIAGKYTRTSCQGGKTGYQVGSVIVCFEDSGHYHVSPTGN